MKIIALGFGSLILNTVYLYQQRNKLKTNKMKNLIKRIEILEAKQENGTITFEEQALYIKLSDLADKYLFPNS